jgi:beta-glucosidase
MTFSEKMLEAAKEGVVLLRNEKQTLPLRAEDTVSVFGRIQFDFYRSGTGSGGSVHVPYITNLTDSLIILEDAGSSAKINRELAETYRNWIKDNPFDNGNGWATEPFSQKDMEISEEFAAGAAKKSNKALYVIGRLAGEDRDFVNEKGSWLLSDTERKNIRVLCGAFEKVVIVFNTCGIMDTSWIDAPEFKGHLTAVMYVWHGGQEGGRAAAEVLCGVTSPGGKLTDTIAYKLEDYPSTKNFAGELNYYQEDIYVGYRYFSTFAKDKVMFPFGFGLSYAEFELGKPELTVNGDVNSGAGDAKITVKIDVKNISKEFSGKEVVQVYFKAPDAPLQTPFRQLAAFGKTKLLAPGQSETLEMSFELSRMASYDDSGVTGNSYSWLLQAGEYRVYAGTDVSRAEEVLLNGKAPVILGSAIVLEKLEQACAPDLAFKRLKQGKSSGEGKTEELEEDVPLSKVDLAARIKAHLPEEIKYTGNKGITFDDVKRDRKLLKNFVAQLNVDELSTMIRGEGMLSRKVTPGIAAAYGGLSEVLHDTYRIPVAGCSDGPSGIRMDTGTEANLMPIGTQLACSWNLPLIQELYVYEGKELCENKIDALLGPGINIHRNPLNGRNFEYFSEDPLLTGLIACAEIRGLHEGGSNGTVKHYALNSQETARRKADAIVSERALREIYLKGFEIAAKGRVLNSLMTSYNPIQGHWAASNYDLVNTILRQEWGYTGVVMTDWWCSMNDCVDKSFLSVKNSASMLRAGTDVYMVVENDGAAKNCYGDNIKESLENGKLTLGELQTSVIRLLNFILDAEVSKRELEELIKIDRADPCTEKLSGLESVKGEADFVPVENKEYALELSEDGIYSVRGVMCKVENTLSQSSTIIFINDKPMASFVCRTTNANDVLVNATQIKMKKGVYKIRMENTKAGIELKNLKFTTFNFNPVAAGYLN